MRFSKLFALSIIVLLIALGAAQVLADAQGDDLVVCCDVIPPAPSPAPAISGGPICGSVQSCVPIDGSIASINRCKGIVMGCAESAFVCTPSAVTTGKQDCACAALVGLLCPRTR